MLWLQVIRSPNQASIPSHTGLELRVVCRIQPDDAPAPTEPRDAELRDVTLTRPIGPGDGCVEIRHHLSIRDFGHDLRKNLADVGHLRHIALTGKEFGRDGQVPQLGKPATDVPDMLMDA